LQPSTASFGIIPDIATYYMLPFEATLESVGDALILKSNGLHPTPDGLSFLIGPSFTITMQHGEAVFDMHVPIGDYPVTVTGASALLVPEHRSLHIAIAATIMGIALRPRRSTR